MKFSFASLARQALTGHQGWTPQWRSAEPKPAYDIVIVGGGLGAARTAEQLRRSEFSGRITIVSDETHLPYDRPPLSKEVLRKEVDDVALKPRAYYDENDIVLRLGSAATGLDTAAQTVTLADGTVLGYDELVIATGLVPRRIPAIPDLEGIRVLRSFDESMALRQHAADAQRAVVIGAGLRLPPKGLLIFEKVTGQSDFSATWPRRCRSPIAIVALRRCSSSNAK